MPSPIARSSSVPDYRIRKSSFPSNHSTCSSQSSTHGRRKPPVFLTKHRRSSKSCDLTEESLSEHNRRQAAEGKRNTQCSPYYKGLLDSQRHIDRMRSVRTSSGNESIASKSSSPSSISTIIYKIQGWGSSCFRGKGSKNAAAAAEYAPPPAQPPPPQPLVRAPSPSRVVEPGNSLSSGQSEIPDSLVLKEFERRNEVRLVEQKPLREGVWTPPSKGGRVQQTQKEPTEEKFGWAKKYRPKFLKDFICNRDKVQVLQDLVSHGECNHIIFEGPPGVGKKTMVWALLREAFGPEKLETREELKEFKLKGEGVESIEVNVRISSKHIEIDLSELRGHEKSIIVAVIEESKTTNGECDYGCRVVVLYQADRLSTDAQHYIRWIMERYKGCIKVMFCCSDVSKLQPMIDICKHIPLSPPSKDEIIEVLEYVAGQEGISLSHTFAERIAEKSKQNLRQAIRSFEASWQANYPFKEDQVILTGWEEDIANIAKNILDEQSPKQLYVIRGKLQKLIEHDVSPDFIFDTLVEELRKHLEDYLRPKLDAFCLEYKRKNGLLLDVEMTIIFRSRAEEPDKRNNDSGGNDFHGFMKIEEFTAKFMSFYKSVPKKDDPTAMEVREELLGKTMLET